MGVQKQPQLALQTTLKSFSDNAGKTKNPFSEQTTFDLCSDAEVTIDARSYRDDITNRNMPAALQQVFEASGQTSDAILITSYPSELCSLLTSGVIEENIRNAFQVIKRNKVEAKHGFQTSLDDE